MKDKENQMHGMEDELERLELAIEQK